MTLSETVLIRTPEGIEFTLPLAGPLHRMIAFIIDFAVILSAGIALQSATSFLRLFSEDAFQAVAMVLYFATSVSYGALTEWLWRGQTIGKRLLNLRVVDAGGLRLQPAQVVVRNLMRFVDFLPGLYLVGGVSCFLSRRRQRLGDLAAGTLVIRTPAHRLPGVEQLLGNKFNSLGGQRHLAARLRQKVAPELAWLALDAVVRRDELQPESRLGLFHDFAGYFKDLVPYPAEVVDQIPDEQYVRNVVEVLFKRTSREGERY